MKSTLVEENVVALHILLQELTSNSRSVLSDSGAEHARIGRGRQLDPRSRRHSRNGTKTGFGKNLGRFHSSTQHKAHQLVITWSIMYSGGRQALLICATYESHIPRVGQVLQ